MEKRIYAGIDLSTRKASRKLRFIEAGKKIIASGGYQSATLRALCREAGLTERYFYESFDNTEALYLAVLDHLMLDLKTQLLALINDYTNKQAEKPSLHHIAYPQKSGNPPARQEQAELARQALRLYFTQVKNPVFGRIALIKVFGINPVLDQRYIENTREFARIVLQVVHIMEPALCIEAQDEEIVGAALLGCIVSSATGWMLQGYPYSVEQMVNNCLQILLGTTRQLASTTSQRHATPVTSNAATKTAKAL